LKPIFKEDIPDDNNVLENQDNVLKKRNFKTNHHLILKPILHLVPLENIIKTMKNVYLKLNTMMNTYPKINTSSRPMNILIITIPQEL
jgi:hypothetical protein